jgi:hypothetical protein
MTYRVSLTTVAGFGVAISLAVCSGATAQAVQPATSAASPAAPAGPPSDAQIRSELRQLNTMKADCLAQAQQALVAQRAASAGGRLSDVDGLGQTLKDRMACVDRANQDLFRLQIQLGPAKGALFASEDRFHQEYRQGLQAQLSGLQRLSEQLAEPDAVTYAMFAYQMGVLRRHTDTFKNRYIRLLKEAETWDISRAVFQASDLLIASAQTWKEQLKAEAEMAAVAPNGPSTQLSRAEAAHDAALRQRASQWETARRLISEAAALAATRYP